MLENGQNQHEKGGWAFNTSWAYNTYSTVITVKVQCTHDNQIVHNQLGINFLLLSDS